jgi:hypothetical protein
MNECSEKEAKKAAKKAREPRPEFFTPPPASPPEQPEETASSIYSASVSREGGSVGGYQLTPPSVRLWQVVRAGDEGVGVCQSLPAYAAGA